jgi:PAS domain S-box-containing protein
MKTLTFPSGTFFAVFRAIPVPAAIVTVAENRVVDVNDTWVGLTRIRRDDAIGRTPLELELFDDPHDFARLNRLVDAGGGTAREIECRLHNRDGAKVVAAISIQQFDVDGEALRVMVIADLTVRNQWAEMLVEGIREANAARKEERARIARDLHDDISQRLALLQIGIDQLKGAGSERADQADARIEELSNQTRDIIGAIRSVVYNLHPPDLSQQKRPEHLLANRCATLGRQLNLAIDFSSQLTPVDVPPAAAECLVRVLQEALSNVAKHSGARIVRVRLWGVPDAVFLTIRDYGAGLPRHAAGTGIGLETMNERVTAQGGSMWITSHQTAGQGTTISVRLPLPARQEDRP